MMALRAPKAVACGASVSLAHICDYCELDDTSKPLMRSAMNQLGTRARAFNRVLKLARTIADLVGAERIQAAHLAETIHLRLTETTGLTKALSPAYGRALCFKPPFN